MNSITSPAKGAGCDQSAAMALSVAEEERRIRRKMRLDPRMASSETKRVLSGTLVRGALLLTGGFCLGWGAFRVWNS